MTHFYVSFNLSCKSNTFFYKFNFFLLKNAFKTHFFYFYQRNSNKITLNRLFLQQLCRNDLKKTTWLSQTKKKRMYLHTFSLNHSK